MKTYERTIFIHWKINDNNYAAANKKHIQEPNRILGSSIQSVGKILANGEEQRALMRSIIALPPNSPHWDTRLADYWNSLRYEIPEVGKELNIGFTYSITDPDKLGYINAINKDLEESGGKPLKTDDDLYNWIENRIKDVIKDFNKKLVEANKITNDKNRESRLSELYKHKWQSIYSIESDRYKVGTPIEPEDYVIYRFAMGFSQVANEKVLIDKSSNIKFYLHSIEDIKAEADAKLSSKRAMMSKYLEVGQDIEKIENIMFAMGKGSDIPTRDDDKPLALLTIAEQTPEKFIAIASDKNLEMKGSIEKFVLKGIINRLPNSTILVDGTNPEKVIGNTLEEAISYLANDKNKGDLSEYNLRYKNLPN